MKKKKSAVGKRALSVTKVTSSKKANVVARKKSAPVVKKTAAARKSTAKKLAKVAATKAERFVAETSVGRYRRFLSEHKLTKAIPGPAPKLSDPKANTGIKELERGVYSDGMYVLISQDEAVALQKLVDRVYSYEGKFEVFAVDWMGRLFGTDKTELDKTGAANVSCIDLAEPSGFFTEANFDNFHNVVAVKKKESLFNLNQFKDWTKKNKPPSDGKKCVGYKVPLFLGGPDSVKNMELTDRSVYLHLQVELWLAIGT